MPVSNSKLRKIIFSRPADSKCFFSPVVNSWCCKWKSLCAVGGKTEIPRRTTVGKVSNQINIHASVSMIYVLSNIYQILNWQAYLYQRTADVTVTRIYGQVPTDNVKISCPLWITIIISNNDRCVFKGGKGGQKKKKNITYLWLVGARRQFQKIAHLPEPFPHNILLNHYVTHSAFRCPLYYIILYRYFLLKLKNILCNEILLTFL